jgi:hypothetical protein
MCLALIAGALTSASAAPPSRSAVPAEGAASGTRGHDGGLAFPPYGWVYTDAVCRVAANVSLTIDSVIGQTGTNDPQVPNEPSYNEPFVVASGASRIVQGFTANGLLTNLNWVIPPNVTFSVKSNYRIVAISGTATTSDPTIVYVPINCTGVAVTKAMLIVRHNGQKAIPFTPGKGYIIHPH